MTVRHPDAFARNNAAGFDGLFDWDFLLPAFKGTKIEPMDLDAVIERNGKFLVFETKDGGKTIPKGQRITLERLISDKCFTVIICRKRPNEITNWEVWKRVNGRVVKECIEGDTNALVAWVHRWFLWADKRLKKVA